MNSLLSFDELKENLKKDSTEFKTLKIAISGDSATQFLVLALKGYAAAYEIKLETIEIQLDQLECFIQNEKSELHSFKADFVIIFISSHKLQNKFYKTEPSLKANFANNLLDKVELTCSKLINVFKCQIILYNLYEINNSIFGNYANKTEQSFLFQQRMFNLNLMQLAEKTGNISVCDLSSIQNQMGKSFVFAPNLYIATDIVLSLDVLPYVAKNTMDIILSLYGTFNKCLIIDLDNTIWGGTIGDDGLERIEIGNLGIGKAFTEIQLWIKQLKERGILLAVCSKNDQTIAMEAFEKHPDMVLKLEDIAVFVANWNNKADNISYIQHVLNIGFDSMVFLDDSPFERNLVKLAIPEIKIPELPEDPADYLEFLYTQNLFETATYSLEDFNRTKYIQTEQKRVSLQQSYINLDDFYSSLNMISHVEEFNSFNIPRVHQLIQRSNQFNLRTIRYSESELEKISNSDDFITFSFSMEDKFGDFGIVSAVILKKADINSLFIDTWLMSCRVLNRGLEYFVLQEIIEFARNNEFGKIIGNYIPTSKNGLVMKHYEKLGFIKDEENWHFEINSYKPLGFFIKKE